MPKEETFPIPLKYIDVIRFIHTDLDVMHEKRVADYWTVDSNRSLSDSWKGFTKFTLLKEKPPKGYMWSGCEIDQTSNDYQTRSCVARSMDKNGKAAQNRVKQEWKNEKPKLDNAGRLTGMYFIDLDDQDDKETDKKTRGENWKYLWHQRCLAKGKLKLAPRK